MAPLTQALRVSFQFKSDDGTFCYCCNLDSTWAISAVPHGGYSLGVIVEACIQYQSTAASTSHMDPIYISAQFLRAANVGIGQVRVKLLKSGKTLTNVLAELVQQGTTKITAHLLFGDLSPPHGQPRRVLKPPSPYARRVPLYSHPSAVSPDPTMPFWMVNMEVQMSTDATLMGHNDPSSAIRATAESIGGGGVVWGAWYELIHKDDKITTSSVPHFCDAFVNLPYLLPQSEPGSVKETSWFPTIAITIEFKARIPSYGHHSARTVGLYCESRFQNDPEGRHNARMEVWTAPSEIGQGNVAKGWRDRQYCIAVADQMALMLPGEASVRQGVKSSVKL